MAGKGSQTPQPMRKASRSVTPSPAAAQNGPAQSPRTLQRSGSLRLRGEAARNAVPVPLRREKTADTLRPRRARPLRSTAGTPSPDVATRGACSLPQSPTPSRRSSGADSSWETQSVLNSSSPFSTDGISRNGTTFSSRHNKYLIHCAQRVDDDHYLTPTQRTTRDLKRLRGLLDKAHETIQQKDSEIHRLKQEVISLRLRSSPQEISAVPADLPTPDVTTADPADLGRLVSDLSGDLDRLSDPENTSTLIATSTPESSTRLLSGEVQSVDTPDASVLPPVGDTASFSCPILPRGVDTAVKPLLVPSVGDSGTFDCLTSPSISSKESVGRPAGLELEERFGDDWEATEHWIEWEEKRLREESERRIAELNQQHAAEYQEMKEKYNDKVEGLLQKLTEANGRYFEIRPLYDASRLRVGQLELELEKERVRAGRTAETRDSSVQTSAEPARAEHRPVDSRHISIQTAAGPAQVAAQSQTSPPLGQTEPSGAETTHLSAFQLQHLASRPSNIPPERIQVAALVHSPEPQQPGSEEAEEREQQESEQVQDGAEPDPAAVSPDLAAPVTRQPQAVAPPSLSGSIQMVAPFTRYFAHVAAQASSNPGQRTVSVKDDSEVETVVLKDSSQMAAPVNDDSVQVAELSQRLSQTESELARVRSLYCQQLALLEDSQPSAAAAAGRPASLEMDPPMRLQFLKSAVFHYLTDKDDYVGHMRAISAVLQFSDWELQEVERVRSRKTSNV